MVKVKIATRRNGKWKELREIEMPAVPRVGEPILFEERGQETNLPVGEHEVIQVKHYYYWQYPDKSETVVCVRSIR